jgi:hypothetical protein
MIKIPRKTLTHTHTRGRKCSSPNKTASEKLKCSSAIGKKGEEEEERGSNIILLGWNLVSFPCPTQRAASYIPNDDDDGE